MNDGRGIIASFTLRLSMGMGRAGEASTGVKNAKRVGPGDM